MHPNTDPAWLAGECAQATNFAELLEVALAQLRKFDGEAEIVCGPITTGGRGSHVENLHVFNVTIERLLQEGRPIFNQIPYEAKIFELRDQWRKADATNLNEYFTPILTDFYGPLFRERIIRKAWFIPGWRSSQGARWERRELVVLGTDLTDLSARWITEALQKVAQAA